MKHIHKSRRAGHHQQDAEISGRSSKISLSMRCRSREGRGAGAGEGGRGWGRSGKAGEVVTAHSYGDASLHTH